MQARVDRVQLFVTCLVDHFSPEAGLAAAAVLERLGITVEAPADLTCCGQPAFNSGFWRDAKAMARHTIDVLSRSDAPIVMPSGSCADMVVHHYAELLASDPTYGPRAAAIAGRTFELSQFLVDVLGIGDVGASYRAAAVYHPSCHTLRGMGVDVQPRRLLERVRGLDLRPLPDDMTCCGFGGVFAVRMAEISGAMLGRKLDAIEATGVDVVVGTDVSCLMHIGGGLRRRGSRIGVRHLAEILAAREAS